MQWIQLLQLQQKRDSKLLQTIRKYKKLTLYGHNSALLINQVQQSFSCIYNSKKLSPYHSILGKIHGSFMTNQLSISNILTDHQLVLNGKWNYQKIQLTKFAFRYNQRSNNNISIKVNPINGHVQVVNIFLINQKILMDQLVFRQLVTDACQQLGQEAERIFNTIMEIFYQRQANQPYLKSGIKVNPNFPRYMKAEKLLDKVKSLIATSNRYKIRVDTSSAHKNRSYFKKIYLLNQKKLIESAQIQELALLYQQKYNKHYEQIPIRNHQKKKQYIKDYTQLEQKNEIQFAKHLNEHPNLQGNSFIQLNIQQIHPGNKQNNKVLVVNKQQISVIIDAYEQQGQTRKHSLNILKILNQHHPNIAIHYFDSKHKDYRITQGFNSISLQQFLQKNKKTMSLSTKFSIMAQICHSLQFLHTKYVGCFYRLCDFIVDDDYKVKLRNLSFAYAINKTIGWKDVKPFNSNEKTPTNQKLQVDYQQERIYFPQVNTTFADFTQSRQNFKKGLDNQKCDIFSLGVVLYRVLMGKLPFFIDSIRQQIINVQISQYNQIWRKIWTLQTEQFLMAGGPIVKLIGHLLLKCFNSNDIFSRPYVEWLTVILSQIKTSLNGLY